MNDNQATAIAWLSLPFCVLILAYILGSVHIKRHGGLLFWRIGRLGGSIYFTKQATCKSDELH